MKWWFQPSNQEKSIIQLVSDRLVISLVCACGRRQRTHVNTHHGETENTNQAEGLSWFLLTGLLVRPPADDPGRVLFDDCCFCGGSVCRRCVCAAAAPICVRIWGGTSSVSEGFLVSFASSACLRVQTMLNIFSVPALPQPACVVFCQLVQPLWSFRCSGFLQVVFIKLLLMAVILDSYLASMSNPFDE